MTSITDHAEADTHQGTAVLVTDLYKGYGSGRGKVDVLQGLDMVVPTGAM